MAFDGDAFVDRFNRYLPAERHKELYKDCVFPPLPNMLPPAKVVKQKPVWTEPFQLKQSEQSKKLLESIHAGTQEEIRLRAAMMASVDEGVGMFFDALERTGQLTEYPQYPDKKFGDAVPAAIRDAGPRG